MCANCKFKVYMKHFNTILLFAGTFYCAMMLHSCTADVDLNNIDTATSVKANLATPVGTMSVSIGDFLGDGSMNIYVDSLDKNGVLTFKDTFSLERAFHKIDLSQYVSSTSLTMNVYDKLADLPFFTDGKITGNDALQIPLVFPVSLKLDGINQDESHQRIDSVLVKNARFVSNIGVTGGLPLEWEWIDKVELSLADNFHRADGKVLTVYERGDGYGYNEDIDINVDNFSLDLMKNKQPNRPAAYWGNVVDTCNLVVTMYITIPSEAGQLEIPADAGFSYNLSINELDYRAVWGMFEPSGDMSNADEISIAESWDAWKAMKRMRLPFANPKIRVDVTTQIAGALTMYGEYLYVVGADGQKVNATFNEAGTQTDNHFHPENWLRLDSEIGASTTMNILFDNHYNNGHIDKLFTVDHPDKVGYKFDVKFDENKTPQIRLTDNTNIHVDAICNLPFVFNEGVELSYEDTMAIENNNLSDFTLDSLLAEVEMIDTIETAELKLALSIENTIPLQMKAVLRCLDAHGNVLMNPNDSTQPFLLTKQDTILIPAPTFAYDQASANWNISTNKMTEVITVDEQSLEVLSNIHQITYAVSLDDESMKEAYQNGYDNIKLTKHERLNIFIGVGANIEAILNLGNL